MASQTQWTWDCANSGRYSRTGKPGVLQLTGSQRVRHDLATEQQLSTGIRKYSAFKWNLNKFSTEITRLYPFENVNISYFFTFTGKFHWPFSITFPHRAKGSASLWTAYLRPAQGSGPAAGPHTDSAAEAPRVAVWNSSEEALKSITQWLLGFAKTCSLKCSSRSNRNLKTPLATTFPSAPLRPSSGPSGFPSAFPPRRGRAGRPLSGPLLPGSCVKCLLLLWPLGFTLLGGHPRPRSPAPTRSAPLSARCPQVLV